MTSVTTYWLNEGGDDHEFVMNVRAFGVRKLARAVKMPPARMSRWISGKAGITKDKLDTIERVLNESTNAND